MLNSIAHSAWPPSCCCRRPRRAVEGSQHPAPPSRSARVRPASPAIPAIRRRDAALRLHPRGRRSSASAYWSCSTAPGSASTCAPAGLNESAAAASGVDAKKMVITAMLISGAVAGLVGMPELLGEHPLLRTDFPAGSASPASPSRCSAATTRSASRSPRCCSASWTGLALAGLRRRPPRRSSRSCRASIVLRSSSPTRSSAARHRASSARSARNWPPGTPSAPDRDEGGGRHEHRTESATSPRRRPAAARRRLAAAVVLLLHRRRARCWSRWSALITGAERPHLQRHVRRRARARRADRPGRARRPVGRAGGRGQHRPRRHDDPRHLVRRLGRLPVGPVGRRARRHRSAARSAACCTRSPP